MAGVDLAGCTERVGAALPGSESAAAAVGLAASWERGVRGWAEAAGSHGDNLAAAADAYGTTDTAAGASIDNIIIPGLDRPG